MFRYSQYIQENQAHLVKEGVMKVATGEMEDVDNLFNLDFVGDMPGQLYVRFSPTDRKLANLVCVYGRNTRVVAILSGDIRPGRMIPEYIEQVVQDIPPYVPPQDWGKPIPLDDLFKSGVVKKV